MTISEKVAYLKGLADGLDLQEKPSKEGKLIAKIIDILEDVGFAGEDLEVEVEALTDEVESVAEDLSDVETMEIAIIENLQREDLNPIEEAEGLQALIDRCGFTQDQVAASVGKSRPAIANSLRLLKLPPEVREMTKSGAISAGHARALLGLPNAALIYAAAEQIVSHKLTVRDVEKLAKRSQQEAGAAPKPRSRRDAFYDEVELALKETLGRKVRVVPGRGKGTLEIEFYSNEDLKDLANKLGE